jgi:hypothetical protein
MWQRTWGKPVNSQKSHRKVDGYNENEEEVVWCFVCLVFYRTLGKQLSK